MAGYKVEDCGVHNSDAVDYPVRFDLLQFHKLTKYLILVCGSGIGVVAANRNQVKQWWLPILLKLDCHESIIMLTVCVWVSV